MHSAAERSALFIPLQGNTALNTAVLLRGDRAGAPFSENELVTVRILSILKNNTIRIAVKGTVLQAQIKALSQDIREGAFLLMRAHLADHTIVLTPYQKPLFPHIPHQDVFAQLGIPQSDLAAALIAFFRQNEQPLQSRPLLKILSSLYAFAPHEKKAAFAAALLYSRGIEPLPQLIEQCLAAMFALPGKQHENPTASSEDADLFRFLNHVKTGKNHWVVFPFEKQLNTLWEVQRLFCLICKTPYVLNAAYGYEVKNNRKHGHLCSRVTNAFFPIGDKKNFQHRNGKNSPCYCMIVLNPQDLCPIPYGMPTIQKRMHPLHQSIYPCRIE